MRSNRLALLLVLAAACDGSSSPTPGSSTASASPSPTGASPAPGVVPAAPPAAAPANGIDPCLLGTWRLTPEHATEFYRAVMAQTGSPAQIANVEGASVVTLDADGNTTIDMSNVRVTYRVDSGGMPMEMSMRFSGTGHADFTTSNGTITYTNSTNSFSGSVTVRIQGREQSMPWNAAMGESLGSPIQGAHTYRCSPGELVLTTAGVPPVTWVR